MRILAINSGSSTLKFDYFHFSDKPNGIDRRIAHGIAAGIGVGGAISFTSSADVQIIKKLKLIDHSDATQKVLSLMAQHGITTTSKLSAIGHRVVHGGDRFTEPTLIDNDVLKAIEDVSALAPLHNEPSLITIKAMRKVKPAIPMVAVFDTAFHRSLPERAWRYAIPQELADKHGIRRYGFHGLAHRYMSERYAAIAGAPASSLKLITLQLGNGCSAAAIEGGCPIDTSMGFTPLEGLVMGTRSGDIDPSLVNYIARCEKISGDQVEDLLNKKSGLLGLSGKWRDMRELLKAEKTGDAGAALAIDIFCYHARKYIGSYLAALGGADAIIFGGGIGENAPSVRTRILSGMDWCGLKLDEKRNEAAVAAEGCISADGSDIEAYVIPVDEASIIAHDTMACLKR
ncbi:MAG: acetate kinase [Dehalococcoidia bacterium]|jgi:acetate kinase